jgi:hypothetical protein
MAYEIIDYKSIKIEDINLEFPKKIKGGSYFSLASYNNKPIYIQTPRLQCFNGIQKSDSRCSMELCLDKSHLLFYEFITNIDDYNILKIQENSSSWFKKDFPLDVVEEFYKTPVKLSRNKQAPKLKLKIGLSKGNLACDIYDNNKNVTTYDCINNNDKVICILQFIGLRFLKQQVICEWNPIQIKITEINRIKQPTYLINETLLSDNEEELTELASEEPLVPTELVSTELVSEESLAPTELVSEEPTEPIELVSTEPTELTEIASEEPIELVSTEPTEIVYTESTEIVPEEPTEIVSEIEENNNIIEQINTNEDINLELNLNENNIEEILKETQNELNKFKELNNSNEFKLNEIKNRIQNLFNNI